MGLWVVLGLGEVPLLLGRNWQFPPVSPQAQPPPRGGKGGGPASIPWGRAGTALGTSANPQGYIVIPGETGRKEFRVSPGKLLNTV